MTGKSSKLALTVGQKARESAARGGRPFSVCRFCSARPNSLPRNCCGRRVSIQHQLAQISNSLSVGKSKACWCAQRSAELALPCMVDWRRRCSSGRHVSIKATAVLRASNAALKSKICLISNVTWTNRMMHWQATHSPLPQASPHGS